MIDGETQGGRLKRSRAADSTACETVGLEGVIFDMDGLMIDTEPIWTSSWKPTLEEFGIHEVPEGLPDACRGTAGNSTAEQIRRFLGDSVDALAIFRRLDEIGSERTLEEAEKKPGLDELLTFLESENVPMAVASSGGLDRIEAQLDRLSIRDYFTCVVSGRNLEHPKPAPDVFLLAADRLEVNPAHAIVLEDSPAGITAAHAGGFLPIMVPDMVHPTPEICSKTFAICSDLIGVRDVIRRIWLP